MALEEFFDYIDNNENCISKNESKNHNVLTFAFVGDALFTLFVRSYLVEKSTAKSGVLHTKTTNFVKASYQSYLIDYMMSMLDEEEKQVVLSARNAKTHNIAKHSNLEEYKKSTSFEALIGYLYLTNQTERLKEILNICKVEMEKSL